MSLNLTDIKHIRQFGAVAFAFFGCLCVLGIWTKKPIPTYFFGTLSLLGLGFILLPLPLKPVYNTWLKIAHFLGRVVDTDVNSGILPCHNTCCSDKESIWRASTPLKAR
jgi:hypothetical protein